MKIKLPSVKKKNQRRKSLDKETARFKSVETKTFALEKIAKIPVALVVSLVAIFFVNLKGVSNLEFNKQVLLIIISVSGLVLYFLEKILRGEFEFGWSPIYLNALIFLALVFFSAVFSRWPWGSFWGWPLDTADSFLSVGCLFVFYFLFSHLIKKKEILFTQTLLVVVGLLLAIFGGLQLSGKFLLPWEFTQATSFNAIGGVNSWAIFLGALLPMALVLILISKGVRRIIFVVISVSIFIALLLGNYQLTWMQVLIAMFAFLVFGLWRPSQSGYRFLVLPAIVLSCALLFGLLRVRIPGLPDTPLEVIPSFKATIEVAVEMLKSSPKDFFFGWGPGTFRFGWSKFKNPSLNQTIFWGMRFSKGRAEILDMLGKLGVLGTTAYILLIGVAIFKGVKMILFSSQKEQRNENDFLLLGVLCSFLALSAMKFLYPVNLSLSCLWWFLLANIAVFTTRKTKLLRLTADSRASFAFSFLGVLILVGGVFLFYLEGTRYLGEVKYVEAFSQNDFEPAKNLFLQAVRLNPQQENFWQDLSGIYLLEARQEMARTDISAEVKSQQIGGLIANAVAAAKRATEINPNNVANWQTRALVYREIIGLSQGSFDWSVKAYEKALELEPSNPFILVELGRAYLVQAGFTTEEGEINSYLDKAQDYFRQAIELKPDYAQAYYQLALVYEVQGRRDEAIVTLEAIKRNAGFLADYNPLEDVGLAFQLGILYYRDEQFDKGREEFERAIALSPTYSNARYFLGLIYDKNGEREKAIEEFRMIQEFNPDNEEVGKILSNLEAGLPALIGIAASEETIPIIEEPEER